jgi:hypothetical protein
MNDNAQVVISDINFRNLGTFTAGNGTIAFVGSVNNSILGNNITFNNLKINKNNSDLTITAGTNFNVIGNLQLVKGDLDLSNSIISLGTTGIIVDETEDNRIKVGDPYNNTGTITISRTINNSTYNYSNLSNIGIEITTPKNLGNIIITRGHQIQTGNFNESVERYYIIPDIGEITSSNYIRMKYFDVELNGLIETDLQFFQTVSYGSDIWWTPCSTSILTPTNVASFTDPEYDAWIYNHSISFDDKFTLALKDYPLPVELLSFNFNCETLTLNWTTASEINNVGFIIEKSTDFETFQQIGYVQGVGNNNVIMSYSFIDSELFEGDNYYRLKQIDADGGFEYSAIAVASCFDNKLLPPSFDAYPNPTKDIINIYAENLPAEDAKIIIYNIVGSLIYQTELKTVLGIAFTCLDMTDLLPAMYVAKIISGNYISFIKIEKQ